MTMLLTEIELRRENRVFEGTGGRSEENRGCGFEPAFLDNETRQIYLSRFADGRPAPCHLLDGLRDEVVVARDGRGRVAATKASLVAGFLRCGEFYTRDQAVAALAP
ncbi:MAG: hypothetical protein ROZ37_05670 [Aromatoleum sp.]|jgi:hypothetical protein|uniref:hypothetical protein n=1 Tax=Aromatoleum sp. TaxID=2307007 RepID=UPI002894F24C|nr:hypothetical protein [Aromatoleum sp.]MDT3669806.1 hypothetical protein [Aromatoleum sp.]